ncbi:MAG: hypothetical protein RL607_1473 [Bacteroidota bacterium]|jgi:uncharacterized protein YndB with AHSA1/START domain
MMTAIRVSEFYSVSPEMIWQALTEVKQMKFWYFNVVEFRPEVGFTYEFYGGKDENTHYLHRCTLLEVIPNKKLKFSWVYVGFKGYSEVTFELFPSDRGTLLQLTHEGVASFEQENKNFDCSEFESGWNYLLKISLKNFLME